MCSKPPAENAWLIACARWRERTGGAARVTFQERVLGRGDWILPPAPDGAVLDGISPAGQRESNLVVKRGCEASLSLSLYIYTYIVSPQRGSGRRTWL